MDLTEALQAIKDAGDDEGAAKVALAAYGKAAVDAAAGVEDVTAPLKAKNTELITKLDKRRQEMEELQTQLDAEKAARAADAAGVDSEVVERMASERAEGLADVKFKALEANWTGQTAKLKKALEAAEADRDHLIGKYQEALLKHQLYVAEPEVDPVFYKTLYENAAEFATPRANGDGEWWRSAKTPVFQILDPETKTPLPIETVGELIEEKRAGDWKALFPVKGQGGGMTSSTTTPAGGSPPIGASSRDLMASVLGGG
jgi:hypothetical protein